MNFKEWVWALEKLGSDEDPIVHNGAATTPANLAERMGPSKPIRGVVIRFYSANGFRTGTPYGMLLERRRTTSPALIH